MSPHFHSIHLKQLIFLDVNLKVLAHLKEITEEHLLSLLTQSLESHLLYPHQVLLAVEVIDLCHTLLLQFCNIHYFRLSDSRGRRFLVILIRRLTLVMIRFLKALIVLLVILLLMIFIFFIMVDLRSFGAMVRRVLLIHHCQLALKVIQLFL
jgi:hypothetical protein